jgi:hypothetical protein
MKKRIELNKKTLRVLTSAETEQVGGAFMEFDPTDFGGGGGAKGTYDSECRCATDGCGVTYDRKCCPNSD